MSNIKKLSTVFAGVLVCFVVTPLMAEPEVVRYSRYPESKPVNNNGVVAASVCNNLSQDWPSPFTNAVCWSDGSLPHKGVVYAAGKIDNADSVLWTPIQSENTTYDMFDALVLETGCTLCIRHNSGKKAIFNNLRIAGKASIYGPDVDDTVLGGKLYVDSGAQLGIRSYNGNYFTVESEISGSGDVLFDVQGGTRALTSYYYCYGMNTNFHGKISVNMGSSQGTPTLAGNFSTLTVTNAANLGGKLAPHLVSEIVPFTYNALTLLNKSKLKVNASNAVLAADFNRGILISGGDGRIDVPESAGTVTVNWPITIVKNCRFYKEGRGHLALGNQLWFCDNNNVLLEDEVLGTGLSYYIDIREGSISATHCNALNGAYIAFSNNTEMVMWADSFDIDIKKYGIRIDKKPNLTAENAASKGLPAYPLVTDMPIRLCVSDADNFRGTSYKIPIVTVRTKNLVADFVDKLIVRLDIKGYRLVDVTSEANGTLPYGTTTDKYGVTTFYANIIHNGLVISVR